MKSTPEPQEKPPSEWRWKPLVIAAIPTIIFFGYFVWRASRY